MMQTCSYCIATHIMTRPNFKINFGLFFKFTRRSQELKKEDQNLKTEMCVVIKQNLRITMQRRRLNIGSTLIFKPDG